MQSARGYARAINLLACPVVDTIAALVVVILSVCSKMTCVLNLLSLSSHTRSIGNIDTVAENGVTSGN